MDNDDATSAELARKHAYNCGLADAANVIRGGIHAATARAGLWGTVDDEEIYIAVIEGLRK